MATDQGSETGGTERVVDTREPGPLSCADRTNRAMDGTAAGAAFLLVADHDPTPLRYMLQAERPGEVTWEPLQQGPDTWQVRVGRVAVG